MKILCRPGLHDWEKYKSWGVYDGRKCKRCLKKESTDEAVEVSVDTIQD